MGRVRVASALVMSVLAWVIGGGVAVAVGPVYTYAVGSPIGVGFNPTGVAVDATTRTVYVANYFGNSVSVIDETSKTVTATISVGGGPVAVAVDPGTHTVYVAHKGSGTVSVIDGTRRTVTATISVGGGPGAVAVDTGSHSVYVPFGASSVAVIDGASQKVTSTIAVGSGPNAVAVDPGTHQVYVAQADGGGSVSVIDGTAGVVTATITAGSAPDGVTVDPGTHTIYVANAGERSVSVIDGASQQVTGTIAVGSSPFGVTVDPGTHTIYVANAGDDTISVIDGATGVVDTLAVGENPDGLAVDPGTHTAFVTLYAENSVVPIVQQATTQNQSISFTSTPPGKPVQGGTYAVSASGGGSGLPVTFTIDASSAAGACTVSDHGNSTGTVSFTGLGSCVIDADQAAGPGYSAAPQAQQTLTVGPAAPAVVTPTSGAGQSAAVGQPFPARLVVSVTDPYANPVPGAPVSFTVSSGSATFGGGVTATVTSDASGVATSPVLTAGNTAGPVLVTATSGSGSGVFVESVIASEPASADLTVSLSAPARVRAGSSFVVQATVTNRGPSAAAKTLTAVSVPPRFAITSTGGGVRYGSSVVFVRPNGFAANGSHTYTVTLTAAKATKRHAIIRAATISDTRDPRYRNNTDATRIRVH